MLSLTEDARNVAAAAAQRRGSVMERVKKHDDAIEEKKARSTTPVQRLAAGNVTDLHLEQVQQCLAESCPSVQLRYCDWAVLKLNNLRKMIVAADTAGSAKKISKLQSKEDAAIASELAAEIYKLEILEKNFQDSQNNVTRFLIMSKQKNEIKSDENDLLTTLVFVVRSIPASLYKCLGGFASNGVNITKLESYIHPQGFDVAQFYIDFEWHPDDHSVKLALEEMKFFCKEIKVLGVYKKSDFRKK